MRKNHISSLMLMAFITCWLGLGLPSNFAVAEQNQKQFRQKIIENIISGKIACDFSLKVEEVACLAFQSAVGSYKDAGFEFGNLNSYVEHSDGISLLYAIEAANLVVTLLPSGRYSLANHVQGTNFEKPGTDAEVCLDKGYGICGNHTATFIELMKLMGVEARAVQLFYHSDLGRVSHIAAEAKIGGRWRFFDTTWGAFFTKDGDFNHLMSFSDVQTQPYVRTDYATNLWGLVARQSVDPFDYIASAKSVVYGYDSGVIFLEADRFSSGKIDLSHIPNFIGDNNADGDFEGVSYKLTNQPMRKLEISISGVGGCSTGNEMICVNGDCQKIASKHLTFSDVPANASLHIKSAQPVCYTVFDKISFQ